MRSLILRGCTVAALVAAVACSADSPTGVSGQAANGRLAVVNTTTQLASTVVAGSLMRLTPLPTNVVATKVIGPNGGSFSVPGTGLTVTVAKGAVSTNTTFSATAYAGSVIGYDFAPHQQFNAPITLTQDFKNTNVLSVIAAGNMPQVGYFADKSAVDWNTGDAALSEMIFTNVDVNGSKVSADVRHFSGYLMSSGRK